MSAPRSNSGLGKEWAGAGHQGDAGGEDCVRGRVEWLGLRFVAPVLSFGTEGLDLKNAAMERERALREWKNRRRVEG